MALEPGAWSLQEQRALAGEELMLRYSRIRDSGQVQRPF